MSSIKWIKYGIYSGCLIGIIYSRGASDSSYAFLTDPRRKKKWKNCRKNRPHNFRATHMKQTCLCQDMPPISHYWSVPSGIKWSLKRGERLDGWWRWELAEERIRCCFNVNSISSPSVINSQLKWAARSPVTENGKEGGLWSLISRFTSIRYFCSITKKEDILKSIFHLAEEAR